MNQKVLILDFGSQYTQLIARRVREASVYSEIYPFDITAEEIFDFGPFIGLWYFAVTIKIVFSGKWIYQQLEATG